MNKEINIWITKWLQKGNQAIRFLAWVKYLILLSNCTSWTTNNTQNEYSRGPVRQVYLLLTTNQARQITNNEYKFSAILHNTTEWHLSEVQAEKTMNEQKRSVKLNEEQIKLQVLKRWIPLAIKIVGLKWSTEYGEAEITDLTTHSELKE